MRTKIEHLNCLQITVLDIDGFRMDKGLQITADAEGEWSYHIRQCAAAVGKRNFFIPGEVVGGNPFSAVYIVGKSLPLISLQSLTVIKGRGKEPSMAESDTSVAVMTTENSSDPSKYVREKGKTGFDSVAFHYSIYRSLKRFLGSVWIHNPTTACLHWRQLGWFHRSTSRFTSGYCRQDTVLCRLLCIGSTVR